MRDHPSHGDADREVKVRTAERYLRVEADNAQLRKKVDAATNSLARTFDRIVGLLAERGFIAIGDGDPNVTTDGRMLARIYSESDLWSPNACAPAPGTGWAPPNWPQWSPRCSTSHAAARIPAGRPASPCSRPPSRCAARCITPAGSRRRCGPTSAVTGSIPAASPMKASSPRCTAGPAPATWRRHWTPRKDWGRLDRAVVGGDFVRWCRQVLDLLDQLRNAAPGAELRTTAKQAIDTVLRGVVAVDAG